jgi:hypothetical protein
VASKTESQEMMEGGDSKARTVQKGHGIARYVDFLGNLKEKEYASLSRHLHDIKLHHHKN